jgi:hypothetical protein
MTDVPANRASPTPEVAPIAQLVGEVYETATPAERGPLLETLMRPLSLLCLAAVSGGVFTAIRLRNGWDTLQVRIEDTMNIRPPDVSALADMVQQVDANAIDRVARWLLSSPALATTAAAVLLLRAVRARRMRPD